jgi:hypothetical protein
LGHFSRTQNSTTISVQAGFVVFAAMSQEAIEGGAGKKLRNLFPTRPAEFLLYEKSVLTDALRSPLIHNFSRLGTS